MPKKILITGAGGFIGGFFVEEALKRGYETWAAVRATTSRKYLSDERIKFIELDFSNTENLAAQLGESIAQNGKWDYVIHNLGATKCANFNDFNTINYQYLKNFVDTLIKLNAVPDAFLQISSLGAMGIGDEVNYTPLNTSAIPNPNTRYGVSKLKAETYLQIKEGFPYIIFRPTGVYGPREKDYFLMFKSIKCGLDFSVGMRRQLITFIYVKDLTRAAFQALESGVKRKAYLIAEDRAYTQSEFRKISAKALGKKFVLPVRCPLAILYIISMIAEIIGMITLKPSTLNRDKFKIMKQRNWTCDISQARKDFGFEPEYSLERGVNEAIAWYKENNWL
ncbi:MAG: NAD(P)-dependent oxidoreductase [Muribaculaceae bacterium]|nr:NAD(P)-dependent oxidoreductase [Muribaculaceae bacterium]